MNHALTLITFIPLAGMVLILAMPDAMKSMFKWIAVAATIPQLPVLDPESLCRKTPQRSLAVKRVRGQTRFEPEFVRGRHGTGGGSGVTAVHHPNDVSPADGLGNRAAERR